MIHCLWLVGVQNYRGAWGWEEKEAELQGWETEPLGGVGGCENWQFAGEQVVAGVAACSKT